MIERMQNTKSEAKQPLREDATPVDVVVFGEVLYDCFPEGQRVLGGAPFNVAWGLKGFGYDPLFISSVADDIGGHEIRKQMLEWGMSTQGLQTSSTHATGEVSITIEGDEPRYEICGPRAWDAIDDAGYVPEKLLYHGLLAIRNEHTQRSLEAILQRSSAKRFFDVNLRPPHFTVEVLRAWVTGAAWLKLNIDELRIVLGVGAISFAESEAHVRKLINDFGVENVLLTGGSQGAMILGQYGQAICAPAPQPERMVDVVGAGDSFSAYTIHGILSGLSADVIVRQASHFASKVCAMQGATSSSQEFYTKVKML
ncbi:MAG: fructokinase [Kiritimatiellia bacterium]|jgi:fructokinase